MPIWGWVVIGLFALGALLLFVVLPYMLRLGRRGNIENMMRGAVKPTVYAENVYTESVRQWEAGEVDMALMEKRLESFPRWEELVYDEARKLYFPDNMPELQPYIQRVREAEKKMREYVNNIKRSSNQIGD